MFSSPFPGAFGLDIGDLSIKLIQLKNESLWRNAPQYKLINCRSTSLPPGLIVNGELQKPEEVRQRIAHLLKGNKNQKPISSPWVVACLPEGKSFIKLVHTKQPDEELVEEDILDLAKKHIPFDNPDDYYFQWQFIPNENSPDTQILIGAIPKTIADSYTYLLESLGLGVVALEIEAVALTRSMITARKNYGEEARAILDLGATRSSLIVFDHDIIQFSTSLPYSGELITTALSQKLHLSYEEAEEIKKNHGLVYEKNKEKILSIMIEMNNQLINYLKNSFNFYYSHFENSNKITRIILCGGGATTKKLDEILSAELKIPVAPGNTWKNLFSKKLIEPLPENPLSYATAIGLALRAADNPFFIKNII